MGGRYKGALAEVTSSSSKAKGRCACLSATSSSLVTVSPWLRTPHSFRHGSSGFLLSLLPQPLRLPGLSSPSSWVTSAPPRLPAAGSRSPLHLLPSDTPPHLQSLRLPPTHVLLPVTRASHVFCVRHKRLYNPRCFLLQ